MDIAKLIAYSIEDRTRGRNDVALLLACLAVDATSRKLFADGKLGSADRYKKTLRAYTWLLEPMILLGMNLDATRFPFIKIPKNKNPDFADVVYSVFRCALAHGDAISPKYDLVPSYGTHGSNWRAGADGSLNLPDRLIPALQSIAVFSKVNADLPDLGTCYISLGDEHFPINEWRGREDDFRPIAQRYNKNRVIFDFSNWKI
jgi:hypothetical protein